MFTRGDALIGVLTIVALLVLAVLASLSLPVKAAAPESAMAASPSLKHYHVSGLEFRPEDNNHTYENSGLGCIYQPDFTAPFYAPLVLPEGAVIKFVQLFSYDTAPQDMGLTLLAFHDGAPAETLAVASSAGVSGFGTTASPEITHTVDMSATAYVFRWQPTLAGTQQKLCGVRVDYISPPIFGTFLPTVQH